MIVLAVGPSLAPADTARLDARLRALPRGTVVVCDVSALTEPDLAAVEALARLRLTAGRCGIRVGLRGASARLRELLALTGLEVVLPPGVLGVEPGGQAEEGEEAVGVEEGVEPGDAAV
ncbi:STAS domain-containing protein [Streptomyces sp. NBC_01262]|uniref:STAS domain-containing protein n=1 Tax=Streptomyces sp. NBC_01262 TaxID=2903803 RepID=UPI002E365858|nr:STAS domain-containing protein [Streptomyces sp. NBC_01262]